MPKTCSSTMLRSKWMLISLPDAQMLTDSLHFLVAEDFQSPFDATVVYLLNASGTKILGKTNCDEFGMGLTFSPLRFFTHDDSSTRWYRSLNVHLAHKPVINPFQHELSVVDWDVHECCVRHAFALALELAIFHHH